MRLELSQNQESYISHKYTHTHTHTYVKKNKQFANVSVVIGSECQQEVEYVSCKCMLVTEDCNYI